MRTFRAMRRDNYRHPSGVNRKVLRTLFEAWESTRTDSGQTPDRLASVLLSAYGQFPSPFLIKL